MRRAMRRLRRRNHRRGSTRSRSRHPASGFKRNGPGETAYSERRSSNPDVLYGREFSDDPIAIEEIRGDIGEVVIRGKILTCEQREIRNERTIISFATTDFSDTIVSKIFVATERAAELAEKLAPGTFIRLKGSTVIDRYDHELTIGSVFGIMKIPDFTDKPYGPRAHEAGGAALPYQDERYGRRVGCEGYHKACHVLGTQGAWPSRITGRCRPSRTRTTRLPKGQMISR